MSTEIDREQYIADCEEDERTLPSALARLTAALAAFAELEAVLAGIAR